MHGCLQSSRSRIGIRSTDFTWLIYYAGKQLGGCITQSHISVEPHPLFSILRAGLLHNLSESSAGSHYGEHI